MTAFAEDVRQKVFFYANRDAQYYDLTAELTQPCIHLIHDTMIDLVEYSLTQRGAMPRERAIDVLDVGSGTGAEAFRLLDRSEQVHIVAVDFSAPMNQEFQRKFAERYPGADFASRVTLLEEDIFDDACSPERLLEHIPPDRRSKGFDAVLAGFLLHHYPADYKRDFYARLRKVLCRGGVLVHGDLFTFYSEALTTYAHDFGEHWIRRQFASPDSELVEKMRALGSEAARLCRDWLDHWNNTHIYSPSERPRAPSVVPADADAVSHVEMVEAAGFRESGYPFRLWEAGVLWALA